MEVPFTVLMSVYSKEHPEFLQKSLASLVDQTVRPSRIVLVRDGKLTPALDAVLEGFQNKFPSLVLLVGYDTNRGLGEALQFGIRYVETPWIARMDADDIALPNRFESQVAFIKAHPEVDVVGTYLAEFNIDESTAHRIKRVPVESDEIATVAKLFNPMNHMTVFMKKDSVEKAGGYRHAPFFEDYDLWVRMLSLSMKFSNIPECLVRGRVGNDMVGKRHGWQYMQFEYQHFTRMRHLGFITPWQYYRALAFRLPLRLMPKPILAAIYGYALRGK
jgi:glycosyltransferase involved in cell wall biosynthesis